MNTAPAPDAVLELVTAFRRTKIMFTAVRLGIFDQLASRDQTAASLAAALNLNEPALTRLLDGCRALGLLDREGGLYRNTAQSTRYLVSASPDTLAGYIIYSDKSLYQLWDHLDDAVREGVNRWEQVFGSHGSLFDFYFRDPVSARSFLSGMHGFGQIASDAVVRAFDLSRFRHLVDLGGATGHLALAACRVYPKLTATVFDLPAVEPFAREYLFNSVVAFKTGDFFANELPPADLYCLGRIIHDWSDPKIVKLLAKILAALPPGGGLLVSETLVNEDRSGPLPALLQDLNMLVCTEGKERTPSEYIALLESAGFSKVEFRRTNSLVDAILGIKD